MTAGRAAGVPAIAAAIAAGAACKPDLGDPPSLITEPRILAVRGEPAEVEPDHAVAYQMLIAAPDGTGAATGGPAPDAQWGFCTEPAPLSSNNAVDDGCLATADPLPDSGPQIQATIPIDTCSVFGPTPPAPLPGQPPRRPHDADVTGGYYQPVRVLATLDGASLAPGIGLTRITCDLANAPLDIVRDFNRRYRANTNPTLVGLAALDPAGAAIAAPDGALPALPPHTAVTLRASWTADSAESFPVFDPASRMLVDHREAIRVSWFVSAGALAADRTGRGETETETFADDIWTTPDAGPAYLWVVLRDTRGGVAFAGYAVAIAP
ncbi:MAG TPA: hypothetical protein VHW23_06305 [Kofleriaceae bacterium]|jgi:hypothetical protein|nr:hypothetical protein [Kofleriaceae bacterium]